LVQIKPDDGHEWPKHVVLILILIFKNIHPLYHTAVLLTAFPQRYLELKLMKIY